MSRVFVDDDLLSWEAFASAGRYGLPDEPKIVFHCLSDRSRRALYVRRGGDNAEAEQLVHSLPDAELRAMLGEAEELD
jgi:hypothetical protein